MDRVCGLAILLLLVTYGSFCHRRTEKGGMPKFRAVNFIPFDDIDFLGFFLMMGENNWEKNGNY